MKGECKGWAGSTLASSSHHFTFSWRDPGIKTPFSSHSEIWQWFLRCHWKNLIYCFAGAISSPQRGTQCADLTKIIIKKLPNGTCFSIAVRRPIRDISCHTEQTIFCRSILSFCLVSTTCLLWVWPSLVPGHTGSLWSQGPVWGLLLTLQDSQPNQVLDNELVKLYVG